METSLVREALVLCGGWEGTAGAYLIQAREGEGWDARLGGWEMTVYKYLVRI